MKKYIFLLLSCFIASSLNAQWMWGASKLKEIKKKLNTPAYAEAYSQLIKDADRALSKGPYSVTYKKGIAPSGDKHDYVSLSRYAWPDPDAPNGLPYKIRDGRSNPELENYDRVPLGNMAGAVGTLSLAYYYSKEERYAKKAAELLHVWFVNEDTRMNPHLNYAQFIPGANDNKGRAAGLIDTYSFVDMLNAIQLLEGSESYTRKDKAALQQWFADLSAWWKTAPQAIAERNSTNNHGLAYDMQLVTYSLFSGDKKTVKEIMDNFMQNRLFTQVEPDGTQPRELRRTLAFHYSVYNIRFMVDMCATAKSQHKKFYKEVSPDGRSLYKAIDFLTPYLGKQVTDWPYQQISGWEGALQHLCNELLRIASIDPTRQDYLALYNRYNTLGAMDRNILIYGIAE